MVAAARADAAATGNKDYDWFLAVLFPASQLQILPYNRAVHDLNGLNREEFLGLAGAVFSLKPNGAPKHFG